MLSKKPQIEKQRCATSSNVELAQRLSVLQGDWVVFQMLPKPLRAPNVQVRQISHHCNLAARGGGLPQLRWDQDSALRVHPCLLPPVIRPVQQLHFGFIHRGNGSQLILDLLPFGERVYANVLAIEASHVKLRTVLFVQKGFESRRDLQPPLRINCGRMSTAQHLPSPKRSANLDFTANFPLLSTFSHFRPPE